MLAQESEGGVGEGDEPLLGVLAGDLEALAAAVDVRDEEVGALHEAEPAGVDGGETDAVGWDADGAEHSPDLVPAENDGELAHPPGPRDAEDLPLAAERALVEELDAAEGDLVRAVGHLPYGGELDKVAAHLILAEQVNFPEAF